MKTTKVVTLGKVRDLLAELEKARQYVLSGKSDGVFAVFMDSEGQETAFCSGVFKEDPKAALRAALKLSAAPAEQIEPPRFQASQL